MSQCERTMERSENQGKRGARKAKEIIVLRNRMWLRV